jgi:hypothetical protein
MPARIDTAMNPKNSKYSTVFTAFHLDEPSASLKKKKTIATISVTNDSTKISLIMRFPYFVCDMLFCFRQCGTHDIQVDLFP